MDISTRISEFRKSKGLTQAEFAKSIGVSPGNVGDWERGRAKPGADALIALMNHFDVSIDWLLTGQEKFSPSVHQEQLNTLKRIETQVELSVDQETLLDSYDKLSTVNKKVLQKHAISLVESELLDNSSKLYHSKVLKEQKEVEEQLTATKVG